MSLSVLYVDDEPELREVGVMSLELDPGLEVRSCGSGQEALAMLENWKPDLVLLDMMMPDMDGPATHVVIRERYGDEFPVAYITARTQEAEQMRLKQQGAIGVLAKPFDPMTLAAQVRKLFDRV